MGVSGQSGVPRGGGEAEKGMQALQLFLGPQAANLGGVGEGRLITEGLPS